jgi:serine/threonine-protein kinase
VAVAHVDIDELRQGSAVGPYDLLLPIGIGGMARVWAARVRGKPDIVALKMLLPELAENEEFRKMFFDEARIASRVRHPNVCGTFEMGEQQGTLYLVMEWLDGPSLMRVLRPGADDVTDCERVPIRPRVAARIVADACAGLHAAHELVGDDGRPLAVVHRDVSPHNLLLTNAGEVKITDFGVAKALGKSHMTIAGQLKGKLAYMAPEQLTGAPVDRRCDVFALGCVLYEITTGQRPFQGEHDPQIMTSIVLGRYEPPAAVVPSYPHELSIIVMRALANAPENRYASADEMRQALERYLRGSGPQVGQDQIAALLRERCGTEMESRAAALRSGTPLPSPYDGHAPSRTPANPNNAIDSGGPMMMEGHPAQAHGVLWVAIAALIGASLGIGVLSYLRTSRKAKHTATAIEASTAGAASAATVGLPRSSTSGTAAGAGTAVMAAASGANTSTTPTAQGRVHLRVSPSSAIVLVDGVVVPRGTDVLAKPQNGSTMIVLVRADKYEDTIVMVDSATPDEVEVSLLPSAPVTDAGSASAASTSPPVPKPHRTIADPSGNGTKDAGASALDTPPNPYD